MGLDDALVGDEDAPPASGDGIDEAVAADGVELLVDEFRRANVGGYREEGEHVDAVNVFHVVAKVGCVVRLVLE